MVVFSVRLLGWLILISSAPVFAQVVRPKNGEPAHGSTKVLEVEFSYNVEDHGWFKNQASEHLDTSKSFWFEFKSGHAPSGGQGAMKSALIAEAAVKCAELGQMEYAGQIANLAPTLKPALESEIENPEFSWFDDGVIVARLTCQIHVEAR